MSLDNNFGSHLSNPKTEKAFREAKKKMSYHTKEEYAKMIVEDDAIVEAITKAKSRKDAENVVFNVLSKYDMMKILR